ncbi:MAG: phosphotransferase [Gemmatimonadetes bacterium]|nr:phosphotransferase [Gemmatimonadota bacterium]
MEGTSVLDAVSDSPTEIPRLFAEAIWKMNQISPDQVPSVAIKDPNPQGISNPLSWIQNQLPLSQLPHLLTKAYDFLKREKPEKLPRKVFGNGDVGPQNFICRPENVIAIIDWEFVGFNDPLRELMLLHTWPEEKPFLQEYPIDRIYCEIAGIDPGILHWYEMLSNVIGWIYSSKDGQMNRAKVFESCLEEAL